MTYLISDLPGHISLGPLKRPERLAEVELDVVSFAFHADTQQQATLSIEVQPILAWHIVPEMRGVQLERCSSNAVMIAESVPIPDSRDDVEWPIGRDIDRLVPSRIEVTVDNSSLRKTLLILIAKDDIRVAQAVHVAGFEILRLDDLNGEDEVVVANALGWRRRVLLNYLSACVNSDLTFQLVELLHSIFDVVEFDE